MPAMKSPPSAPRPAEAMEDVTPVRTATTDVEPDLATLNRLEPNDIEVPKAAANHQGPRSPEQDNNAGLADLLDVLPNPSPFKAGDGSPFRQTQSPSLAAAAPDEAASESSKATEGNQGAGSTLTPVKTTSAGGNAVPRLYHDRTAGDRDAVARRRGGSAESEAAVQAALNWLAANQSSDGRWDADRFGAGQERNILGQDRQGAGARADTAMTGLALLAFLGAGNTHLEG
jgi:hypothetical protein